MRKIGILFLFLFCLSCYRPHSPHYKEFYAHLKQQFSEVRNEDKADYFLVIMVEARHLDYTSPRAFFKTLAKHPSDGSKNGDVGHAWIYLQGKINNHPVYLEGGHSGELGHLQPRYMEGVFHSYERGDKNPIAYLWESQRDGFFQEGGGKHHPTFAAKIILTPAQFHRIYRFIQVYDYRDYAITGNQCCSFAVQVAALAELDLDCEIHLKVDQVLQMGSFHYPLWEDPLYSEITISSPDVLEKSLMQAVQEGRATYALNWYYATHARNRFSFQDLVRFPERYLRFKSF